MELRISRVDWEFVKPFRIAYRLQTHSEAVIAELTDGVLSGRGEALGVSYRGETAASIATDLHAARHELRQGISVEDVLKRMSPGGAACALDCAYWDLQAKRHGKRAGEFFGIGRVRPLETTLTLGLDDLENTIEAAAGAAAFRQLKIKLNGQDDAERVEAVRQARPDALLFVDANQSWSLGQLERTAPRLARLGVVLIEQPLPAADDRGLANYKSPVPLCADESCQTTASIPDLLGRYDVVNIKLDKTGGLSGAVALAHGAKAAGLRLMVGCMGGSSLSMAPAFIVGQLCEYADLDGPVLQTADVENAMTYINGHLHAPQRALWG